MRIAVVTFDDAVMHFAPSAFAISNPRSISPSVTCCSAKPGCGDSGAPVPVSPPRAAGNWALKDRAAAAARAEAQAHEDDREVIEQLLLVTFDGRVEAVLVRGNTQEDIDALQDKTLMGSMAEIKPGADKVAIGSRLAENIGARVGDVITVINPAGRSTPFGTVPRQVGYEVGAIFEVGLYDYDGAFIIMPIPQAQTLLLTGDTIGMIEVTTEDADRVTEIMAPIEQRLQGIAIVRTWQQINSSIFEALQVERVAMFFALSFMVVVAAFNILSSLVMLVRSKTRDIAIMRTMGASRQSILKIFVTTGFTVGAIGTAAGLALGALVLIFRQPIVHGIEIATGQNLWDPSIRFLTTLPARTDPWEVFGIVSLALVLSFLATLYPAFKASNTDPVQVLRYE